MTRYMISFAAFVLLVTALFAAIPAKAELTSPPPIFIPYGGNVVTEVNLSDDDVLGMLKQALPVVGEMLREMTQGDQSAGDSAPPQLETLANIDLTGLVEAIKDIRHVRAIVARYSGKPDPETLLKQFNDGVAKAGRFNKVVTDFGFVPGMFALYSEAAGDGYMAVLYNSDDKTMFAARVLGSVDVPAFVRWAGAAMQSVMGSMSDEWDSWDASDMSDSADTSDITPDAADTTPDMTDEPDDDTDYQAD